MSEENFKEIILFLKSILNIEIKKNTNLIAIKKLKKMISELKKLKSDYGMYKCLYEKHLNLEIGEKKCPDIT